MNKRYLCLITLLFFVYLSVFSGEIKIAVISDIHFLSDKLIKEGDTYQAYKEATGRNVKELHAILDHVIEEIVLESPDVLLITGDLTNHGELQSHIDLIEKLETVRSSGISVFVIPGNHDINIPNSKAYLSDKSSAVSSVSATDFKKMYSNYGFDRAFSTDKNSLSYCVEIDSENWLLAFDTNRYSEHVTNSITNGRILPETMLWANEILQSAQQKGVRVVGMMHHGIVEHMPYQSVFFSDYLIEDWRENAAQLADAGLKLVFTGHFHANDITEFISENNNKLYDIETGSLAQFPFPYRIITLTNSKLDVKSYFVDETQTYNHIQEKYRHKLEKISKRMIESKIKSLNFPIANDVRQSLIDLLVKMSLLHVAGDEPIDKELMQMIEKFAQSTGDDNFDIHNFSLDFYPADNNVTIVLE